MILNVDKYIGVPFVDGGRDIHGADCWGLLCLIYKDLFDVELPDYSISAFDTEEVVKTMSYESKVHNWCEVEDYQAGDIIAMAMHPRYTDMVNHVGLFLGRSSFIHTQKTTGAIISPVNHMVYGQRIQGAYRWVI